nr:50S ribosomal protein L3P [uncultured archaeon]
MPTVRKPRAGSMQFHPRARSKTSFPRVRNWVASKDAKLLGFAGYKVGMTHVLITDNRQHSMTKNQDIFYPVTVVECPPIKTHSIRFYKKTNYGKKIVSEILAENDDKELGRKLLPSKKKGKEATDFDYVRLVCHTQPKLTDIGKKIPDVFEIAIGGNKEQQLAFAKEKLGKEITVSDVFKEGQQVDIHAITTGKGTQGPMRRFGIALRHHKSEKSRRNPGSLGAWRGQGHIMWRVAHAGKMGYHLRTEYNKQVLKIGSKPEEINVKGGFIQYGNVKNTYVLLKGSVGGTQKRLIRFNEAMRAKKNPVEAPQIAYTSLDSKQGN